MKITMVGGGSYGWTDSLYKSFLINPFFNRETEICLMDINEKALEEMAAYCEQFNRAHPQRALTLSHTTCMEKAMEGADYAIVAIGHGGLEAEIEDHRIARRNGFYNIKGSEAGVAGASRTIRHVPEMTRIAGILKRQSPNAMLLNVTNPLTAITRAVEKYAGVKAIGFCHGVKNHLGVLAPYIGAESVDDLDFVVAGVDHASFLLDIRFHGRNALDILRKKGMIEAAWRGNTGITFDDPFAGRENQRIRFIIWDVLGYMPAISDEHCGEFFYQAIGTPELRERFGMHYDRIADRTQSVERFQGAIRQRLASGDMALPDSVGEVLDQAIEALEGGRRFRDVLNYRNLGQVDNLPRDAVVETLCEIDSTGVHPIWAGSLPPIVETVVRPLAVREEMYMEAAMEWDERKLSAALAMDPIVNDFTRVRKVAAEIMAYNRRFLSA